MDKDLYSEILDTSTPNHYQLLGLKFFEKDTDTIHKASLQQMKKLKAWDLHEDEGTASSVKEMHVQLSRAIAELEDSKKKKTYDKKLADDLGIPLPGTFTNKESKNRKRDEETIIIRSPGPAAQKREVKNPDQTSTGTGHTLAKTSMILGIMSITCFGIFAGIPAVILGIIGLVRVSKERTHGKGLAITGLITGALSIVFTLLIILINTGWCYGV